MYAWLEDTWYIGGEKKIQKAMTRNPSSHYLQFIVPL